MSKFKVSGLAILFAVMTFAGSAFAATVDIVEYQCRACDKIFYSFKGDDLSDKKFKDESYQLSNVYQLTSLGKALENCKGFKSHIFDKKKDSSVTLEFVYKNAVRFVALKSGGALNGELNKWECFICGKTFYTYNQDNPNIRRWDEQSQYLFNLKGQPIYKCKEGYYGHVFKHSSMSSYSSNTLATVINDLYWIK